jgi:hypothetical protein
VSRPELSKLPRWSHADRQRLVEKLRLYGFARNREVDVAVRVIQITDDEAVMLLDILGELK